MSKVREYLTELFLPVECVSCTKDSLKYLCLPCLNSLFERTQCFRCSSPLKALSCLQCAEEFQIQGFLALTEYEQSYPFILAGKEREQQDTLPEMLLKTCFQNLGLNAKEWDLVLVPSGGRENWIVDLLDEPFKSRVLSPLVRKPGKLSQKRLNREERLKNAMKLFYLADETSVESENLILLDDVVSTGGSLIACLSLLRKLGYKRIFVCTLAYQRLRRE